MPRPTPQDAARAQVRAETTYPWLNESQRQAALRLDPELRGDFGLLRRRRLENVAASISPELVAWLEAAEAATAEVLTSADPARPTSLRGLDPLNGFETLLKRSGAGMDRAGVLLCETGSAMLTALRLAAMRNELAELAAESAVVGTPRVELILPTPHAAMARQRYVRHLRDGALPAVCAGMGIQDASPTERAAMRLGGAKLPPELVDTDQIGQLATRVWRDLHAVLPLEPAPAADRLRLPLDLLVVQPIATLADLVAPALEMFCRLDKPISVLNDPQSWEPLIGSVTSAFEVGTLASLVEPGRTMVRITRKVSPDSALTRFLDRFDTIRLREVDQPESLELIESALQYLEANFAPVEYSADHTVDPALRATYELPETARRGTPTIFVALAGVLEHAATGLLRQLTAMNGGGTSLPDMIAQLQLQLSKNPPRSMAGTAQIERWRAAVHGGLEAVRIVLAGQPELHSPLLGDISMLLLASYASWATGVELHWLAPALDHGPEPDSEPRGVLLRSVAIASTDESGWWLETLAQDEPPLDEAIRVSLALHARPEVLDLFERLTESTGLAPAAQGMPPVMHPRGPDPEMFGRGAEPRDAMISPTGVAADLARITAIWHRVTIGGVKKREDFDRVLLPFYQRFLAAWARNPGGSTVFDDTEATRTAQRAALWLAALDPTLPPMPMFRRYGDVVEFELERVQGWYRTAYVTTGMVLTQTEELSDIEPFLRPTLYALDAIGSGAHGAALLEVDSSKQLALQGMVIARTLLSGSRMSTRLTAPTVMVPWKILQMACANADAGPIRAAADLLYTVGAPPALLGPVLAWRDQSPKMVGYWNKLTARMPTQPTLVLPISASVSAAWQEGDPDLQTRSRLAAYETLFQPWSVGQAARMARDWREPDLVLYGVFESQVLVTHAADSQAAAKAEADLAFLKSLRSSAPNLAILFEALVWFGLRDSEDAAAVTQNPTTARRIDIWRRYRMLDIAEATAASTIAIDSFRSLLQAMVQVFIFGRSDGDDGAPPAA